MTKSALCRNKRLTTTVSYVPLLSLYDLRALAGQPNMLSPCAEYAARFYPRAGLGRMA
jgi:hypothetical protein